MHAIFISGALLAALLAPSSQDFNAPFDRVETLELARREGHVLHLVRNFGGLQVLESDLSTGALDVRFTSGTHQVSTRRISYRSALLDGVLVHEGRLYLHAWQGRSFDEPPAAPVDYGARGDLPTETRGGGAWMLETWTLDDPTHPTRVAADASEAWAAEHPHEAPGWLRGPSTAAQLAGRIEPIQGGVRVCGKDFRFP